ncbi:hypothetical protein pb186bvf_010816 [Paramecium bursaria]
MCDQETYSQTLIRSLPQINYFIDLTKQVSLSQIISN